MPERFTRHFLKTKEAEALLNRASERLGTDLTQILNTKTEIELIQTDFAEIYLIDGKPSLAKMGEDFFPTLVFNEVLASLPKVFVDMGAVPYVCKGANVMAPGITRFEGEFREGDIVLVVDGRHSKPIALGEIICNMEEAEKARHGAVVRNIHFVSDKIWNLIKSLKDRP